MIDDYMHLIDEKTGIGVNLKTKTIYANGKPISEVYGVLKKLWRKEEYIDFPICIGEEPLEDFIKKDEMRI